MSVFDLFQKTLIEIFEKHGCCTVRHRTGFYICFVKDCVIYHTWYTPEIKHVIKCDFNLEFFAKMYRIFHPPDIKSIYAKKVITLSVNSEYFSKFKSIYVKVLDYLIGKIISIGYSIYSDFLDFYIKNVKIREEVLEDYSRKLFRKYFQKFSKIVEETYNIAVKEFEKVVKIRKYLTKHIHLTKFELKKGEEILLSLETSLKDTEIYTVAVPYFYEIFTGIKFSNYRDFLHEFIRKLREKDPVVLHKELWKLCTNHILLMLIT